MNSWMSRSRVVTTAPAPDDLFVVTMIGGRRVTLRPIDEYDQAVEQAREALRAVNPARATVKVLCLTAREAQTMGFLPADLFQNQTPEQDAQDRQLVITTCLNLVQRSNDYRIRTEALGMLKQLGVLQ